MLKADYIENTIKNIEGLLKENMPKCNYQFELHDLITNSKYLRGGRKIIIGVLFINYL